MSIHKLIGAAADKEPTKVEVENFPSVQDVYLINAPAVQDVAVTNAPAVQDVAVVSLPPGPACPAEPPRFQLVGFSDATALGNAGVLGMSMICSAEFDGSRMCTSVEVMETSDVPALPDATKAWVRPIIDSRGYDASGIDTGGARHRLTCAGWDSTALSTAGSAGLTFTNTGVISIGVCGTPHAVACCGLVE